MSKFVLIAGALCIAATQTPVTDILNEVGRELSMPPMQTLKSKSGRFIVRLPPTPRGYGMKTDEERIRRGDMELKRVELFQATLARLRAEGLTGEDAFPEITRSVGNGGGFQAAFAIVLPGTENLGSSAAQSVSPMQAAVTQYIAAGGSADSLLSLLKSKESEFSALQALGIDPEAMKVAEVNKATAALRGGSQPQTVTVTTAAPSEDHSDEATPSDEDPFAEHA